MFQKRLDCDQYTVMIGLMSVSSELLGEDITNIDLNLIRELLMNKVLNFNNHIRQICYWFDRSTNNDIKRSLSQKINEFISGNSTNRSQYQSYSQNQVIHNPLETQKGPSDISSKHSNLLTKLRNLNRNEFFVYSTSLSFNPNIRCGSDLLNPTNGGGVVFTITAKMPLDEKQRRLYLQILLRYLGKNSVLLDVKSDRDSTLDNILSTTNVVKEELPVETSTVLKPIPKYFDEDYSDEESSESKNNKEPNVSNTYSFFRHSSYLLSKYATSKLVPREDDKYVTQRLLQVKLQRNKKGQA